MRRFAYLQDPLCLLSLTAYALNRLVVLPHLGRPLHQHAPEIWLFLHSHFDDVLLIPAALPVVLWIHRFLGLRHSDAPPNWLEAILHLSVWSLICKFVGPLFLHLGVFDPWDLLCYASGGIAAMLWWRRPAKSLMAQP